MVKTMSVYIYIYIHIYIRMFLRRTNCFAILFA